MGDLAGLIERVEKLTGPDREVDAEIDAALLGGRASHTFTEDCGGAKLRKSYGPGTVFLNPDPNDNGGHVLISHHRKAAVYTASLDAAIALVERCLPGWSGDVDIGHPIADSGKVGARLFPPEPGWKNYAGESKNSAIALLLALLRAMQKEER